MFGIIFIYCECIPPNCSGTCGFFILIIDHENTHLSFQIIRLQFFQNEKNPKRVNLNDVQGKRESFMDAWIGYNVKSVIWNTRKLIGDWFCDFLHVYTVKSNINILSWANGYFYYLTPIISQIRSMCVFFFPSKFLLILDNWTKPI